MLLVPKVQGKKLIKFKMAYARRDNDMHIAHRRETAVQTAKIANHHEIWATAKFNT